MASTRRKSAAVALAVLGVAGLSLASAAQLTLNSSSLGAGNTVVASCDADGVDVAFTTALNASNTYDANVLNLTNVAAQCNNLDYKVQLLTTNSSGATVPLGAERSGKLTVAGGAADIALTPVALASDVTGVSVVISGKIPTP